MLKEELPDITSFASVKSSLSLQWVGPFGDMRQELVFIGQNLDQQKIIDALNSCLLTEKDMLKGKDCWLSLPDPFPSWEKAA
jgi:hypothetical protein